MAGTTKDLRRRKSTEKPDVNQLSISSFLKRDTSRKRARGKEEVPLHSPKKISSTGSPESDHASPSSTDQSATMAHSPVFTLDKSSPSPHPSESFHTPLSQEQKDRMESKKLEAESKRIAKKFGAKEIGTSWIKELLDEFHKPYIQQLIDFVREERLKNKVYPVANDVFSWTLSCSIQEVKVVILGQDPYHGPGQAHGMCFSVRGVPPPPSLINIYKELESDVESFKRPDHGYLMGWAKQGVLLLNACLTVRHKEPKSHSDKGWEKLTDAVVHWLNSKAKGLVFLLWGRDAQKKGSFIDTKKHRVLKSVHPSPLSAHRGFLGCRHFSQANTYLESVGKKPIDWNFLPQN